MSWDDFHRRNRALDAVLDHAYRTGQTSLPFEEVPGVSAAFGDRRGLLLALHAKWSRTLAAHLEYELFDDVRTTDRSSRYVAEVAWENAAAKQPTLRKLLDSNKFCSAGERWAATAREFADTCQVPTG
ncbi:hypothetical protein [Rhodococcoides yunnanense]|uniref:hypothetical protein n=1 Tax=Rhodococcoides yunnanense TaxID=278209 RepID=UPI000932324C|nr:hypothetical protein [Rhodococcus yunnanensis]